MPRTPAALNPGSTCHKCHRLLISRPAPISSIAERASSETTSTLRSRYERPVRVSHPLRFTATARSTRDARNAGISPNITAVNRQAIEVKATTCPSTCIPSVRGTILPPPAISRRIPQGLIASPSSPPATASIVLSVSSCRTSRSRPAPRAVRIASSFWREAARASSRWAILAQPISRTSVTAPHNSRSPRRKPPTISS
jgi:hypothetical protein